MKKHDDMAAFVADQTELATQLAAEPFLRDTAIAIFMQAGAPRKVATLIATYASLGACMVAAAKLQQEEARVGAD